MKIVHKIVRFLSKLGFRRPLQKIRRLDYIILYKLNTIFNKVENNSALFLSSSRETITGNFEFIYKELNKLNFKTDYYLKTTIKGLKQKFELTKKMSKASYILVDDFYPIIYPIKLRKQTKLIQVWHAMGAFKTVGYSRFGKSGGPVTLKSLTHRNYDAAIVSSENIRKNYAEAFGIDISKVHATGIPRTDIFFDQKYIKKTKEKIYKKYPMLKNKKVILFAPTFRGNGKNSAYYDFSNLDFKKIKKELKNEFVFIIKMHPFIKNTEEIPKDDDFYLNLTSEREINDLLFITDILITDYSSVIFEYSLLNKKIIFYVPDLEEYISSRDFYYDFSKYTYGSVAKNQKELLKYIKNPKIDIKKLEEFKKYFCDACKGESTKNFIEQLILKGD